MLSSSVRSSTFNEAAAWLLRKKQAACMAVASKWDHLEICGLDIFDLPLSMDGEEIYIQYDFPSAQIPQMTTSLQQVRCSHVNFPEAVHVPLGLGDLIITVNCLDCYGSELIYKVQVNMFKDIFSTTWQTRTFRLHSLSPQVGAVPSMHLHVNLRDENWILFAVQYSEDWAAVMQTNFESNWLTPKEVIRVVDRRGSRLCVRWHDNGPELDPVPEPSNFPLIFRASRNNTCDRCVPSRCSYFWRLLGSAATVPATCRTLLARYAAANVQLEKGCSWLRMWQDLSVLRHGLLKQLCYRSDLAEYILCFVGHTDENSLMQALPDVLGALVWISCRHAQHDFIGSAARFCKALKLLSDDTWDADESAPLLSV